MLQNLHVKNLALIDEVEIDFRQGRPERGNPSSSVRSVSLLGPDIPRTSCGKERSMDLWN